MNEAPLLMETGWKHLTNGINYQLSVQFVYFFLNPCATVFMLYVNQSCQISDCGQRIDALDLIFCPLGLSRSGRAAKA